MSVGEVYVAATQLPCGVRCRPSAGKPLGWTIAVSDRQVSAAYDRNCDLLRRRKGLRRVGGHRPERARESQGGQGDAANEHRKTLRNRGLGGAGERRQGTYGEPAAGFSPVVPPRTDTLTCRRPRPRQPHPDDPLQVGPISSANLHYAYVTMSDKVRVRMRRISPSRLSLLSTPAPLYLPFRIDKTGGSFPIFSTQCHATYHNHFSFKTLSRNPKKHRRGISDVRFRASSTKGHPPGIPSVVRSARERGGRGKIRVKIREGGMSFPFGVRAVHPQCGCNRTNGG